MTQRERWVRDNIGSLSGFSGACPERIVWSEVYLGLLKDGDIRKDFTEEFLRVYKTKLRNYRIQEKKDENLRIGWRDYMIKLNEDAED